MSLELRGAHGDADVATTGFRHDFHDAQLADFNDVAQSFCFQLVPGYTVQEHGVDVGVTFAVDCGRFRN